MRNCNVLCFTETWLNPVIPDSVSQPAGGPCVPGLDINQCSGLVDDAVLLRLPLHAGAGEAGEGHQQATSSSLPSCSSSGLASRRENFAYRLELDRHRRRLKDHAALHLRGHRHGHHEQWCSFSPCCGREEDTGFCFALFFYCTTEGANDHTFHCDHILYDYMWQLNLNLNLYILVTR